MSASTYPDRIGTPAATPAMTAAPAAADGAPLNATAGLAQASTPAATSTSATLDRLGAWSDAGLLRHLDSAFAAFIARLDPTAEPALLVAAAMLSRMEGRGHSCLPLAALSGADPDLLGWPTEAEPGIAELWGRLPATLDGWVDAILRSPVVQPASGQHHRRAADRAQSGPTRGGEHGQPLVIDGPAHAPRLYLRRYWHYERTVSAAVAERCAGFEPVDAPLARRWLERLFGPVPAADTAPTLPAAQSQPSPVDWQQLACALALRGRLTIITGGPGTGKTYTAARLLALLLATSADPQRLRIALAAPTGKAAARLKQSIDGSLHSLQASLGDALDLAALTQRIGAARTLHSLLGARPDTRRFRHHAGNPLDADVVIVDEASMVHLEMMAALLAALPPHARLILLGDKDQLASVEAGAVLGDLCRDAQAGRYDAETARYLQACTGQTLPAHHRASALEASAEAGPDAAREAAPAARCTGTDLAAALAQQTVMLRKSLRFEGPIGALALAVNDATDPARPGQLLRTDASASLFGDEHGALGALIDLAVDGRPGAEASYRAYATVLGAGPADGSAAAHASWAKEVLEAFDRFRILCAVREGDWGVSGLNRAIERKLEQARLLRPQGSWYPGRPVMVTRNDPALGVFNGDIGIALPAAEHRGSLRVHFLDGDQLRSVAVSRLAHVDTAFAMTVHKSQGSEFEHTVLALSAQSGSVLTRELIYTGITRARKAFSLFAERPGLLAAGVGQVTRRESGLMNPSG